MKYTKVIILVGACVIVLAVVFFMVTASNTPPTSPLTPTPSQTEITPGTSNTEITPQYPPTYLTQAAEEALKEEPNIEQNEKVAILNSLLPVEQPLFKLHYDYDISKFVLTLQKGKEVEGSDAFARYIQQNGVESDSWLDLKTVVE